jgi:hypothetical protein
MIPKRTPCYQGITGNRMLSRKKFKKISMKLNNMNMKTCLFSLIMVLLISCGGGKKPIKSQDELKLEESGKAELRKLESMYSNKEEWEARKSLLRVDILKGMHLFPLPKKTPLNSVISSKRIYGGYSVENVSFESIPGYYVCGNLYRPLDDTKKHPAVLCPHGHFQGDSLGAWGRFRPDQQKRCATFARMGAVVFSYSMFAWGGEAVWQLDTTAIIEKPDTAIIRKCHHIPLAITMQTWNSMRVIDFLETLPEVDQTKIAVTGASGGGTQSFLLAALDDRVSVSIPVVMVSYYFKDLCVCERVMPINKSSKQILNMAEFAAMVAPKPMLLVSDGNDWTRNTPKVEYPFIKRTYSFYNAEDNVENVHFPNGLHDYGIEKRVPVYSFLAKHLGLNLQAVTDSKGAVDESKSELENAEVMLAFSSKNPFPANALTGKDAIEKELKSLQK